MPFQKGNQYWKLNIGKKRNIKTIQKMREITLRRYQNGEKFGFQEGHLPFEGTEETRFQKGQIPWNKGIPCSEEAKKKISLKKQKLFYNQCGECKIMFKPYYQEQKCCSIKCRNKYLSKIKKGKYRGIRRNPDTEFKKGQFAREKHPNWKGGISKEENGEG